MHWYLSAVKDNYANFTGRARRTEYWAFHLVDVAIIFGHFLLLILNAFAIQSVPLALLILLSLVVYRIATLVPAFAVATRRMHDTNQSGAYLLMGLIPLVGGVLVLVPLASGGDRKANDYGPSPKQSATESGAYQAAANPNQYGAVEQQSAQTQQQYSAPQQQQPGYDHFYQ